MKETELYKPVKSFLETFGYKVYSEVSPCSSNRRADVFGVLEPVTTVVELKVSLSIEVIEQAVKWIPYANYIYVAVPKSKKKREFAIKILKSYGIGLLEVDITPRKSEVSIVLKPKMNRRVNKELKESLTEYHDTHAPEGGTSKGGYITPYRITIIKIKEFFVKIKKGRPMHNLKNGKMQKIYNIDGWVTVGDILEYCDTHYASPKGSLVKALKDFESSWCESKKMDGRLYFRLKE